MSNGELGVVVRLKVNPGLEDEFVAAAQRTMIEPTQAAPGCVRYELWQDVDKAGRFTILEEWENEEAHTAHLASDWLQPVIADLMPFSSEPFEMQRLHRTG